MPSLPPPLATAWSTASGAVDRGITWGTGAWRSILRRFPLIDRIVAAVQRHDEYYGSAFAAAMSFRTVMAMVPMLMVGFATAGFILTAHADLLDEFRRAIVDAIPGDFGKTVANLMDSAVRSRTTVGIIGLAGAAITGVNWMSGLREAMTAIWGGRVSRNAILGKVYDVGLFVVIGVGFTLSLVLSVINSGGLADRILVWLNLDYWHAAVVAVAVLAPLVSILILWPLLTLVLAKVPLVNLPMRNAAKAGFVAAVAMEILKAAAGQVIEATGRGPAGVAFGSIITIMVVINLVARIMFYATAWCATDPRNAGYLLDEPSALGQGPDPEESESADDDGGDQTQHEAVVEDSGGVRHR